MKISPARASAFDVLSRIETGAAFSSVLLPQYEERLSTVDRGLCHELVMGCLRRQIYLDRIIDQIAANKKLDTAVRIALRLGTYQLLFLDKVPAYSAINESVNLVQRAKKTSAKGLVNAVLRNLSRAVPVLEYVDDADRLATETSHPRWLIEKWSTEFGEEVAARIAIANNTVPRPAFRITRKAQLSFKGDHRHSEFVRGCYFVESVDETLRAAAESGEIYFQDEGSQLVGEVVANRRGSRIFDVCAAPGGKTSQIAAAIEDPENSLVVGGDVHSARVSLLRSVCEKQGVGFVNVLQYDAAVSMPFAASTFETVLVDAPCSGTGTIRHNPEIRYRISAGDLSDLTNKQLAILRNASKLVRLNGHLIYSTCSLQREENEGVCQTFLEETQGFDAVLPDMAERFLTTDGFARTFPHRDGMDGFFIAVFERRAV